MVDPMYKLRRMIYIPSPTVVNFGLERISPRRITVHSHKAKYYIQDLFKLQIAEAVTLETIRNSSSEIEFIGFW